MKELIRFRKFLAEGQLDENKLSPVVVDFLQTMQPEEAPGSWDDEIGDFKVPYSHEDLVHTEEDLLDTSTTLVFMEKDGLKLSDLPTEYTEFETYELPMSTGNKGNAIARNFAKFIPGEGLYYKVTSEYPLNEDQMKNLAKLLRDEADQPDNKVGKSIFLKYAAQAEKTDVKSIRSLLQKLEDELIGKHPDTFSGEDDIVGSFLSVSKNYLNEGAFGDDKKAALENLLTGKAKDMVEDGALFAEYGNVTYDEANLKDGEDPEEIEAIDQIKAAVIKMGDEVQYGYSDEDGTLTYTYLIGDKGQLMVMTRES